MKTKIETKTKKKIKVNFRFCCHLVFHFRFCFCFPKVFAFLLNPRGLEVPLTVNSLSHSIFIGEFSTWPSGAIEDQLSLDWPRSAIAPRNMAPSLIRI